jgi:hypothetical protein
MVNAMYAVVVVYDLFVLLSNRQPYFPPGHGGRCKKIAPLIWCPNPSLIDNSGIWFHYLLSSFVFLVLSATFEKRPFFTMKENCRTKKALSIITRTDNKVKYQNNLQSGYAPSFLQYRQKLKAYQTPMSGLDQSHEVPNLLAIPEPELTIIAV